MFHSQKTATVQETADNESAQKLQSVRTPWRRAFIGLVVNTLLTLDALAKAFGC